MKSLQNWFATKAGITSCDQREAGLIRTNRVSEHVRGMTSNGLMESANGDIMGN